MVEDEEQQLRRALSIAERQRDDAREKAEEVHNLAKRRLAAPPPPPLRLCQSQLSMRESAPPRRFL